MCIECITVQLVTVDDITTVISTYQHWGAPKLNLGSSIFHLFHERFFKIFSTTIFHTFRGRHNSAPRRKKYEGLIMALNIEFHKVSTWLDANKISINTKQRKHTSWYSIEVVVLKLMISKLLCNKIPYIV